MSPVLLLSAVNAEDETSAFSVYAMEMPKTERGERARLEHFTAQDLLGAALAEDYGLYHTRIERKAQGKPRLVSSNLHMNLSHCAGLAVCAVGSRPLGIDVEGGRAVRPEILKRLCTKEETEWILRQNDRDTAFSRIWTLKEAYAKYLGVGIALPFQKLSFSICPGNPEGISLQYAEGLPKEFCAGVSLRFYQIFFRNFTVSLAVEEQGRLSVESRFAWISGEAAEKRS